jgi:acyl-CoA synthetase (AMP-forming)/AMP-acid ligase II
MPESHPIPAMTAAAQAAACSSATIDGVFRRAFTVFADRVAVVAEDKSMTYAELRRRAWQLANALTALGLGRGSRIAMLSETRPEYVETYAACAALGVTVGALNIRLHPEELLHCLDKGKPCALISSGSLTPLVASLRDRIPYLRHWVALDPTDGWLDYGGLLEAAPADEPQLVAKPEDIHNVLFTSGTTGRPKGAMISQRAAATRGLRIAHWYRLTEDDGFIGWLPLFHCGGDESLYATLLSGGVYATLRKAVAETMFSMIERHRLSWTALLPGIITEFLNHPRRRDYDLSSLRFAIGYANMMPDIVAQLTATCEIDFYDAFGQTEASYLVAHGFSRPSEMPSLRKHPTPLLDIRIVDDGMNERPVGEPGECVVRGPTVMSGYLDDPKANEEVFANGWLHTGDLLRREQDGTLTYVDRKKYLIKTGGENVYPAEVEQVIVRHEAVQEVCVMGIPDSFWGEVVKAVIVMVKATAPHRRKSSVGAASIWRPTSVHDLSNASPPNRFRAARLARSSGTNWPNGRCARNRECRESTQYGRAWPAHRLERYPSKMAAGSFIGKPHNTLRRKPPPTQRCGVVGPLRLHYGRTFGKPESLEFRTSTRVSRRQQGKTARRSTAANGVVISVPHASGGHAASGFRSVRGARAPCRVIIPRAGPPPRRGRCRVLGEHGRIFPGRQNGGPPSSRVASLGPSR